MPFIRGTDPALLVAPENLGAALHRLMRCYSPGTTMPRAYPVSAYPRYAVEAAIGALLSCATNIGKGAASVFIHEAPGAFETFCCVVLIVSEQRAPATEKVGT